MKKLPQSVQEKVKESKRTSIFSIISNILLAILKWITGIWGNSFAIIADAIESTADVLSSILVMFANSYSYKPADEDHPYGHGRMEAIATFVVGGFLLASAIIIAVQSIQDIINPPSETPKSFTLYILGFVIFWKEISYQYVVYKARKIGSTSLEADAWHHRSDAVTSVAAFIGIWLAVYLGFKNADAWAALFAACFILFNSVKILKPALFEMMDKKLYDDLEEKIREDARKVCGVKAIDKCLIRKTGMFFHIDIHVVVDAQLTVLEGHDIGHSVKLGLMRKYPQISNVFTHVEPFYEKKISQ